RAAYDLGYERKRALTGAVIARVKPLVRAYDADEGDVFKVEPLGHHLCADHYGYLLTAEALEQLVVPSRTGDRIRVHAEDFRVREELTQLDFDLLRALADIFQRAAAVGAVLVQPLGVAAVVAN